MRLSIKIACTLVLMISTSGLLEAQSRNRGDFSPRQRGRERGEPVAQYADEADYGPDRENRESREERWARFRTSHYFKSEQITTGFLVVNGELIEPPYRISWDKDGLKINDFEIDAEWGHRRARDAEAELEAGTVVYLDGATLSSLPPNSDERLFFLYALAEKNLDVSKSKKYLDSLDNPALMKEFRDDFAVGKVSPESSQRALAILKTIQDTDEQNTQKINAVSRLNKLGYPLTMLGMVLAVVSFGHLLSNRPDSFSVAASVNSTPEAIKSVSRSVLYVVLLSSLDLIWTILAWQAGQMKEMNPLASQFIHDPQQLVAFKAVATFIGAGILLGLKQHRPAQTASWWLCLVCTVLTFRWLTFNSMMMG